MTQTVRDEFDDFLSRCRRAIGEQVGGRTEPFQALWSKSDDVVLMGAAGSHQVGWGGGKRSPDMGLPAPELYIMEFQEPIDRDQR